MYLKTKTIPDLPSFQLPTSSDTPHTNGSMLPCRTVLQKGVDRATKTLLTRTMKAQGQVSSTSRTAADELIQQMIEDAKISSTRTKADWCLKEGLIHIMSVDNGKLFRLVESNGLPSFYHSLESCRHEPTDNIKAPENCFQSLCRIIAGQQLAGSAAQSIWKRLLDTTQNDLTPARIISLVSGGKDDGSEGHLETALQKPSGLSRMKARAILDLARHFASSTEVLSEEYLTNPAVTEESLREALKKVKGLGPWSCDMFIMFHLEQKNVFPFGDLGVRKGVAKVFGVKGKGKQGSLCQTKDLRRVMALVEPYHPYQSLLTYYMWRAADTKDVYVGTEDGKKSAVSAGSTSVEATTASIPVASTTPVRGRKRKARVVTPS